MSFGYDGTQGPDDKYFFVETAAKELPKHTVREKWLYSGVGFA